MIEDDNAEILSHAEYWRRYGVRLRTTRLALGISEQEAAAAYGVTLRTYRRYEGGGGQRGWGAHRRMIGFAKKYDVSLNWLVSGDGAYLGKHLSRAATGNVSILPAMGRLSRATARLS